MRRHLGQAQSPPQFGLVNGITQPDNNNADIEEILLNDTNATTARVRRDAATKLTKFKHAVGHALKWAKGEGHAVTNSKQKVKLHSDINSKQEIIHVAT